MCEHTDARGKEGVISGLCVQKWWCSCKKYGCWCKNDEKGATLRRIWWTLVIKHQQYWLVMIKARHYTSVSCEWAWDDRRHVACKEEKHAWNRRSVVGAVLTGAHSRRPRALFWGTILRLWRRFKTLSLPPTASKHWKSLQTNPQNE